MTRSGRDTVARLTGLERATYALVEIGNDDTNGPWCGHCQMPTASGCGQHAYHCHCSDAETWPGTARQWAKWGLRRIK